MRTLLAALSSSPFDVYLSQARHECRRRDRRLGAIPDARVDVPVVWAPRPQPGAARQSPPTAVPIRLASRRRRDHRKPRPVPRRALGVGRRRLRLSRPDSARWHVESCAGSRRGGRVVGSSTTPFWQPAEGGALEADGGGCSRDATGPFAGGCSEATAIEPGWIAGNTKAAPGHEARRDLARRRGRRDVRYELLPLGGDVNQRRYGLALAALQRLPRAVVWDLDSPRRPRRPRWVQPGRSTRSVARAGRVALSARSRNTLQRADVWS